MNEFTKISREVMNRVTVVARRERFIEPVKISPETAFVNITNALDYYQQAFGLTDAQMVAIVMLYRAGKTVTGEVAAAAEDLPEVDGVSLEILSSRTGLLPKQIQTLLAEQQAEQQARDEAMHQAVQQAVQQARRKTALAQQRVTKLDAEIEAHIAAGRLGEAYRIGASSMAISRVVGRSPAWVIARLRKEGVRIRTKAEARELAQKQYEDRQATAGEAKIGEFLAAGDLAAAYKAGASMRQIGHAVGRSGAWVSAELRKQGVEIRPPLTGWKLRLRDELLAG